MTFEIVDASGEVVGKADSGEEAFRKKETIERLFPEKRPLKIAGPHL